MKINVEVLQKLAQMIFRARWVLKVRVDENESGRDNLYCETSATFCYEAISHLSLPCIPIFTSKLSAIHMPKNATLRQKLLHRKKCDVRLNLLSAIYPGG